MIAGTITCEMAASPDIVLDTILDFNNAERILSNVADFEVVKKTTDPLGVGITVKEVRLVYGKPRCTSYNTITNVSSKQLPYTINSDRFLTHAAVVSGTKEATRSQSVTILQGETSKSSIVVYSFSALPQGVKGMLFNIFRGPCFVHKIKLHFQRDLYDYAVEAEKRQQMRDGIVVK